MSSSDTRLGKRVHPPAGQPRCGARKRVRVLLAFLHTLCLAGLAGCVTTRLDVDPSEAMLGTQARDFLSREGFLDRETVVDSDQVAEALFAKSREESDPEVRLDLLRIAFERAESADLRAAVLTEAGCIREGQERRETAATFFELAIRLSETEAGISETANIHTLLARTSLRANRLDEAEQHFTTALEHYRLIGEPEGQIESLEGLAETFEAAGQPKAAEAMRRRAEELSDGASG